MRSFEDIYAISAQRHGGPEMVEAQLTHPLSAQALAEIPEDRWLSVLTKCVFQAGFNWRVIETKWEGFEAAFAGFDVGRCAFMNDERFDELVRDTRIVRNPPKIATVRDNAAFLMELRERGGAGTVIGNWPSDDYVGLLQFLKDNGSRLGGLTGQYAMRFAGKDSFILSRDVTARLIAEGVIDKPATSKTAMRAVQAAFNAWQEQSARSLNEISRIVAMSV